MALAAFLLATSACTATSPSPKEPVVKTTAWETNGLKVEVTFHCATIVQLVARRDRVTVKVTMPQPESTAAQVSFTVKTRNTAENRPATKLDDSSDAAWLSQTAQDGQAYEIFVYKDGTLIASTRLGAKGTDECSSGDEQ